LGRGDSSFSNEGESPSPMGDNSTLNFFLKLENHWAKFNQTLYTLSLGKWNSNLFKQRAKSSPKRR
jgi:hypothetical protein